MGLSAGRNRNAVSCWRHSAVLSRIWTFVTRLEFGLQLRRQREGHRTGDQGRSRRQLICDGCLFRNRALPGATLLPRFSYRQVADVGRWYGTASSQYGPSGTLLWLIQMGGPGDDEGFDIGFDADRNVYVTGVFTDSATFQGFNNSHRTVTGTGQTIFLAKYTPWGVLAWVLTGTAFNASNNGFGVAVDPATGSIYVTGCEPGKYYILCNADRRSKSGLDAAPTSRVYAYCLARSRSIR